MNQVDTPVSNHYTRKDQQGVDEPEVDQSDNENEQESGINTDVQNAATSTASNKVPTLNDRTVRYQRPKTTPSVPCKEPTWTMSEFQEYLAMLELLQDACSNAPGDEMSLSVDNLGQLERLLTALLPQGA